MWVGHRSPRHADGPPELSSSGPAEWISGSAGSVATHDREDPEQVGVDPDQADGEAEGRTPRLTLGEAGGDAVLHEVEVEDQHEDTEHEAGDRHHEAEGAEAEE